MSSALCLAAAPPVLIILALLYRARLKAEAYRAYAPYYRWMHPHLNQQRKQEKVSQ